MIDAVKLFITESKLVGWSSSLVVINRAVPVQITVNYKHAVENRLIIGALDI